jgi:hypothetical protein
VYEGIKECLKNLSETMRTDDNPIFVWFPSIAILVWLSSQVGFAFCDFTDGHWIAQRTYGIVLNACLVDMSAREDGGAICLDNSSLSNTILSATFSRCRTDSPRGFAQYDAPAITLAELSGSGVDCLCSGVTFRACKITESWTGMSGRLVLGEWPQSHDSPTL